MLTSQYNTNKTGSTLPLEYELIKLATRCKVVRPMDGELVQAMLQNHQYIDLHTNPLQADVREGNVYFSSDNDKLFGSSGSLNSACEWGELNLVSPATTEDIQRMMTRAVHMANRGKRCLTIIRHDEYRSAGYNKLWDTLVDHPGCRLIAAVPGSIRQNKKDLCIIGIGNEDGWKSLDLELAKRNLQTKAIEQYGSASAEVIVLDNMTGDGPWPRLGALAPVDWKSAQPQAKFARWDSVVLSYNEDPPLRRRKKGIWTDDGSYQQTDDGPKA